MTDKPRTDDGKADDYFDPATYIRKAETGMPHDTVALVIIKRLVARVEELEREKQKLAADYLLLDSQAMESEREVARLKGRLALALSAAGFPGEP